MLCRMTRHTHSRTHPTHHVCTSSLTHHTKAQDIIRQMSAKLNGKGNGQQCREYSPSDLLKIEFTSWLLALALATSLFPDVNAPGRILVLERGLQIVQRHLLMEHGRYGARQWRHNPDPICRAAIAKQRKKKDREIA